MLKTLLLNLLYEKCITSLFDSLHKNFVSTHILYKIGDSFSSIFVCYENWYDEVPLLWAVTAT